MISYLVKQKEIIMKISAIAFSLAMFVSFSAFGTRTVKELCDGYDKTPKKDALKFCAGLSEEEWREMADYMISVFPTNREAARMIHPAPLNAIGNPYSKMPNAKGLAKEYDEKFARAGFEANPTFFMFTMPKCSANFISNTNNAEKIKSISYGLSLKRKYGTSVLDPVKGECTIAEYINCSVEFIMSLCCLDSCETIEKKKKQLCLQASRLVKRELRAQGKSFVSNKGANPLDAPMHEFVSAMNAPRFSGLKQWIEKWAPDHVWVEPRQIGSDEISKLKEDIMNGDKELEGRNSGILLIYLGTEGYNRFVDEYNNGSTK